jgi:hypothetical protein
LYAWSVMYGDADCPSGKAAITGGTEQLATARCSVLNGLIENERAQLLAAQEALKETLVAALESHLKAERAEAALLQLREAAQRVLHNLSRFYGSERLAVSAEAIEQIRAVLAPPSQKEDK